LDTHIGCIWSAEHSAPGLNILAARDDMGKVVVDERGRPVPARPAALVRAYEAREPNSEGVGAITMGDLTRQSLRDSPDVVVLGETRGPEMVHVLDALTNGISGVMGLVIAGFETSATRGHPKGSATPTRSSARASRRGRPLQSALPRSSRIAVRRSSRGP
jgi:hypothetical protein